MLPITRAEIDVVVVGAGFAGLAAARALDAAGAELPVLEARDRVGGRTLNAEIGDGKVVELGGQWIGPTQERIAALASAVGVETFPTHTEGDNCFASDGRLRRYSGTIPRLNPLALLDTARAVRKLNRLAGRIDPEAPWAAPDAERSTRPARRLARPDPAHRHREAADAGRRADRLGRRAGGALAAARRLLPALGGQLRAAHRRRRGRPAGPARRRLAAVAERVAEELGDRVVLGAPVRADRARSGRGVAVTGRARPVRARRAIVAMPPALTAAIEFDPPLPAGRAQLGQRMPGLADQGDRDLRRAVLARRRPLGRGRSNGRAR